ncbi:MAG: hypothetical protein COT81_01965 [Candidatus Buchananbacteria bacterium CG10_big_fil_rev_8_21_14_0_10_42_9]|uniref:Formyl transferase C-terminal domain-containing protein n=1 Tax=Candidatus Buchananbacteria bacterium CG10_big_fil_rev_8_21_14_0_10_42_9 TaxID=1974526 RepID=A0A2H0W1T6_9BACT|nr:MAG: hypothetical protein COT81_01965 [Candidatus Buchananbacteria bacterium CG10_big_fil_rev_8_21_14_0_10_42_9]
MRFKNIDKLILFGGSFLMAEIASQLANHNDFEIVVFSSARHLDEKLPKQTLRTILKKNKIRYFNSENINTDKRLPKEITPRSLGVAIGAAWVFDAKVVNRFAKNHLLDCMSIDLPRYRGGAHHTWRILHQNNKGVVNMQIIKGGIKAFQLGPVIMREEFTYPAKFQKTSDFYNFAVKKEALFLKKFLRQLKLGKNFAVIKLNESESSTYPFLSTKDHGLINWAWAGEDIALFINALDDPYPGASTFYNRKKVFIKDCQLLPPQEKYHPFTAGVVVRKNKQGIYLATLGNLLLVKKVYDNHARSIINKITVGSRFFTPSSELDKAAQFQVEYDAIGIKK